MITPLTGIRIVNLSINVPGPVAAHRLQELGANVIKVEPPMGDPLEKYCKPWYEKLTKDQKIIRLNLKDKHERSKFDHELAKADLLITSMRTSALKRANLNWEALQTQHSKLCHIAITGYAPPDDDKPGHDLTYQARAQLLSPPLLPRVLIADMAGAAQTTEGALALLMNRTLSGKARFLNIALYSALQAFSQPYEFGATKPGGLLGGGFPGYGFYQTSDGQWIALAALEPHFLETLAKALNIAGTITTETLQDIFLKSSAQEWKTWAEKYDIPLETHER